MDLIDPEVRGIRADLAARLGHPDLRLLRAERLTAGASRFTWDIEIGCDAGQTASLILQRERVRGAGLSDVVGEASLLRAAAAAGVPVPAVVAADPVGDSVGGAYVLTRRVAGETLARRILRDDAYAPARAGFTAECGRILAAIHGIPVADQPMLAAPEPLAVVEQMLDESSDARPALELGLAWLRSHRPAAVAPGLVHGDFRLGNLIVGPDGIRAVLDWELAHRGDPLQDLGWLCSPAWRFGGQLPVAGCGTREELWAAYEAAGGAPVDPDAAFWWEIFAIVQWGAMCLKQARTHLAGESRSPELAVLGRRAAECEHDLFEALFPGRSSVPPGTPAPAPDLYGRPTATELLESVREMLTDLGTFSGRVAANVLSVVEREIAAGSGPEREHRDALATFGCTDDQGLAAAIRDGTVTADDEAAVVLVGADVARRLSVYNPQYAS